MLTETLGTLFSRKILSLREQLQKKKVVGTVVNMLDEVAWILNLRGSDIDYNPG